MKFSTSLAAAWLVAAVLGEKDTPVEPLGEVRTIPVCAHLAPESRMGTACN